MAKGYTIKSLLFEIIPEAAVEARGEYPAFSQRDLYYGCRDRYLNHPDRPLHREHMLKREKGETDEQYEARRENARKTRAPIDFGYFTNPCPCRGPSSSCRRALPGASTPTEGVR
jgi:hypothetical protein